MNNIRKYWGVYSLLGILLLSACSAAGTEISVDTPAIFKQPDPSMTIPMPTEEFTEDITDTPVTSTEAIDMDPTDTPEAKTSIPGSLADVISVIVSGEPGAYNFSVTVSSPDEGCNQYTDWWEVLSLDGQLIYRRILLHSHVDEQPFTRSGGPVAIEADTIVLVRAHMHPLGYSGNAMKGSLEQGFEQFEISDDFALDLAETLPLPEGCNF